jgi:hypothetical protein
VEFSASARQAKRRSRAEPGLCCRSDEDETTTAVAYENQIHSASKKLKNFIEEQSNSFAGKKRIGGRCILVQSYACGWETRPHRRSPGAER